MPSLLRSMLYVPANSWRMITNATTEGADAVILDLEDGCPMAEKETARVFARDAAPMIKAHNLAVFVRVNALETGLTETDLSYVVSEGVDGIMLAKTESLEDLQAIDQMLETEEKRKGLKPRSVSLAALLETPRAVMNLGRLIEARGRLAVLAFGAGDYSREMGAGMGVTKLSPDEYFNMTLYARSAIATAARAAGLAAIDTPYFGLVIDLEGLAREAERVKLLGFSGKQLTHPRHVAVANEVFSPAEEDVALAKQVVAAYQAAQAKGLGATSLGGKMIDRGSAKRAEALLALAAAVEAKRSAASGR